MSTWTSRYSEKWPRLTALFNLDGSTREGQDPNMRFEQPYPQDPDAYYKFYLHPDDIGQRSLSQYSVGGSDGKKGGSGDTRTSPIRVCLGAMLLFSLAGVVCVAVTLAVLLSQPHRLVYSNATPGNSTPYTASFIAQKERQLQKEICGIMDTLFIFKESEAQTSTKSCNISLKVEEGHLKINFKVPTPNKFVEEDMEKMKLRLLMNAKNAGLFNDLDDLLVDTMGKTVVIKDNVTSAVNETLPFADDIIKLNATESADHVEIITPKTLINHTSDVLTISDEVKSKTSSTMIPPKEAINMDVLSDLSESTTQTIDHLDHPLDMSAHDGFFNDQFVNDLLNMPLDSLNEENTTEMFHAHSDDHRNDTLVEEKMAKSDVDLLGDLGLSMEHLPAFFDSHIPDIHHEHAAGGILENNDTEGHMLGNEGHMLGNEGHMLDNVLKGDLKNLHLDHTFSDTLTTENPKLLQNLQTDRNGSIPDEPMDPSIEVKSKVEMKRIKDSKYDKKGFWLTPEDLLSLSEFSDPHAKLHLEDPHFHHDHSSFNLFAPSDNESVLHDNDSTLSSASEASTSIFPSDIGSVVSIQTKGVEVSDTMSSSSFDSADLVLAPLVIGKENIFSSSVLSSPLFVTSSSSTADVIQPSSSYLFENSDYFKTGAEYSSQENVQSSKQSARIHSKPTGSFMVSSSVSVHSLSPKLDMPPFSVPFQDLNYLEPSSEMFESTQSNYHTPSFEHSTFSVLSAKLIPDTNSVVTTKKDDSDESSYRKLSFSTSLFTSHQPTLSTSSEVSAQNHIHMEQPLEFSKKRTLVMRDLTSERGHDTSIFDTRSEVQHSSQMLSHNFFIDKASSNMPESPSYDQNLTLEGSISEAIIDVTSQSMDKSKYFQYSSSIPSTIKADSSNSIRNSFSDSSISYSETLRTSSIDSLQSVFQQSQIILPAAGIKPSDTYASDLSLTTSVQPVHMYHDSMKSSKVLSSVQMFDSWNTRKVVESIQDNAAYSPEDQSTINSEIRPTQSIMSQLEDSANVNSRMRKGNNDTSKQPSLSINLQHEDSIKNSFRLSLNSQSLTPNSEGISKSDSITMEFEDPIYSSNKIQESISTALYNENPGFPLNANYHYTADAEGVAESVISIPERQQTTYHHIQSSKVSDLSSNLFGDFKDTLESIAYNQINEGISYNQANSSESESLKPVESTHIDIQPSTASYIVQSSESTLSSLNAVHSISMRRNKQHTTVSDTLETSSTFAAIYISRNLHSDLPTAYTSSDIYETAYSMTSATPILPSLNLNVKSQKSTKLITENAFGSPSSATIDEIPRQEFYIKNQVIPESLNNPNATQSVADLIPNTHQNSDIFRIGASYTSELKSQIVSTVLPIVQPSMNLAKKDIDVQEASGVVLRRSEYSSKDIQSLMPKSIDRTAISPTVTKVLMYTTDDVTSHPGFSYFMSTTKDDNMGSLHSFDDLTFNDKTIGTPNLSVSNKLQSIKASTEVVTSTPIDGSYVSHFSNVKNSEYTHDVKITSLPRESSSVFEMEGSHGIRPSEPLSILAPTLSYQKEYTEVTESSPSSTDSSLDLNIPFPSDIKSYSSRSVMSSSIINSNVDSHLMRYSDIKEGGDYPLMSTSGFATETNRYDNIKPKDSLDSAKDSKSLETSQSSISTSIQNILPMSIASKVVDVETSKTEFSSHHFMKELPSSSIISSPITKMIVDKASSLGSSTARSVSMYSKDSSQDLPITVSRYESSISSTYPDTKMTSASGFRYERESKTTSAFVFPSYSKSVLSFSNVTTSSEAVPFISNPTISELPTETQALPKRYVTEYITTVPTTTTVYINPETLVTSSSSQNLNPQTAAFLQLNDTVEIAPFELNLNRTVQIKMKEENATNASETVSSISTEENKTISHPITTTLPNMVSNNNITSEYSENITIQRPLVSSSNVGVNNDLTTLSTVINSVKASIQTGTPEKGVITIDSTDPMSNIIDTTLSTTTNANVTESQLIESISERTTTIVSNDTRTKTTAVNTSPIQTTTTEKDVFIKPSTDPIANIIRTTSPTTINANVTESQKRSQNTESISDRITTAVSPTTPTTTTDLNGTTRSPVTLGIRNRITPNPSRNLLSQRQLQRLRARLSQLQVLRGSRNRVQTQSNSNNRSSSRNGLRTGQNRRRNFPNIPNTPIQSTITQAGRRQPGSFINRNSVPSSRQNFVGTSRNVPSPSRSNNRNAQTASSISNLRPPGRRRVLNPAQNGLLLFNLPGLDTNRFLGGANINWNRRFPG